jgi:Ca-activated chloride channel family protein
MRRTLLAVVALLLGLSSAQGAGLLIPEEKTLPPLAMLNHQVTVSIEDQVAQTRVEQTFRNHTDRHLEATYIFPVPRGASVDRFTMWVDGKETKGELVEAAKAREIYTSIVRRTQDPGLLEYMGNNLLRLRVFPVPPKGDQKVAVRYTAVAPKDGKLVEYVYPLKTDGKAVETLEKFSVTATVKSQHGVINVYSPSHALSLRRTSDKEVRVSFDKDQGALDRDFQLFYSAGSDDVGLTALTHRPVSAEKGFFTLLVSPRFSLGEKYKIPQDLVLVMDTSGSMRGQKMEQARKALKYCLAQLSPSDRFGLIAFATTVNPYEDKLLGASAEQIKKADKWVDELEATGGTAINAALESALTLRPKGGDRPFTIVFFTDGQPTIGETNAEVIFKNFVAKNTAHTRLFTFGVGDDVNAALLDRLAENTRALSAYVRPEEDIAHKVESLYSKMSSPVLTNLKLAATGGVRLSEVYPTELPDLFAGGQLVVMGRYDGKGPSAIKLTGRVGKEEKEFVYELTFPDRTEDGREFVEQLWARRKVGFLLDQIRINGEKKELKDEVVALAKKYGITTPYTSYLIVPDGPLPGTPGRPGGPVPLGRVTRAAVPPGLMPPGGAGGFGGRGVGGGGTPAPPASKPVLDLARKSLDDRVKLRGEIADKELKEGKKAEDETRSRLAKVKGEPGKAGDKAGADPKDGKPKGGTTYFYAEAASKKDAYEKARELLARRDKDGVQTGKLGVDLAVQTNQLRNMECLERSAVRNVNGRNCLEVGGVWIDEGFTAKTAAVVVKAHSDAYFKLLEKHPQLKKVFGLGNYLVWLTPSGTALVIDTGHGKDKLTDAEITRLFTVKK